MGGLRNEVPDMRNLILIIIVILALACERPLPHMPILSFDFAENPHDTLKVYYRDELDFSEIPLGKLALDSCGAGELKIDLEDHTFALVELAGKFIPVLLYPGLDLHMGGSLENVPSSITFSGEGSEVHSYLADLSLIYAAHAEWKGRPFHVLDSADFFERQEQIDRETAALRSGLSEKVRNSGRLMKLLDLEAEFNALWPALNNELVRQRPMNLDISKILDQPSGLASHSMNYWMALSLYYNARIQNTIFSSYGPEETDSIEYIYPELAFERIHSLQTSDELKELLSAWIMYKSFSAGQLTPILLKTYDTWTGSYPGSKYAAAIEKKRQAIEQLESGIPAPEISGITPAGDSLRLSDLLGKVVYVKVWATWCSPCIQSFPDLDVLEAEVASNGLQILCISSEQDQDKWRRFLEGNEIAGLQMHVSTGSFREDYLIAGVPRYILIDPEGRIADPNAPSPDKQELLEEIRKLIRQNI
jgi:thiol-disulfide isomerase/thioredoxin